MSISCNQRRAVGWFASSFFLYNYPLFLWLCLAACLNRFRLFRYHQPLTFHTIRLPCELDRNFPVDYNTVGRWNVLSWVFAFHWLCFFNIKNITLHYNFFGYWTCLPWFPAFYCLCLQHIEHRAQPQLCRALELFVLGR